MPGARIGLIGAWHLGCVASTSLASLGHRVVATDFDEKIIRDLQKGEPPIFEPGLKELMSAQVAAGRLSFSLSFDEVLEDAEYVYVTFDTPVDQEDLCDLSPIEKALEEIARHAKRPLTIVVMSQMPIGTCRRLKTQLHRNWPAFRFELAYQPENLQLGDALRAFLQADLMVLGVDNPSTAEHIKSKLYQDLTSTTIVTMGLDSAEMVKHALNSFLATSISFVNEMANLAECAGADIRDVVKALRLDRRIGKHAFLSPGPGFSGGTLGRDVQVLRALGQQSGCPTPQMDAVLSVNRDRLPRIVEKLRTCSGELPGLRVALFGLTYKPGTSTLRRSNSLVLAEQLLTQGCEVHAYDPKVTEGGEETVGITVHSDPYAAAQGADALVVMTAWPEFKELDFVRLGKSMRKPVMLDPPNFLDQEKVSGAGLRYYGSGIAAQAAQEGA